MLDGIAGAVVSIFILFGGYELIKESNKLIHGGDPKLEKFAKLLESHLKALPVLGALTILWFLNLQEMTKQENLEHVKKGFGRSFPVKLEDKDYETIYAKPEKDSMVESTQGGKLRLTERGREELKTLFEHRASYLSWLYRKSIYPRKINWIAEGL